MTTEPNRRRTDLDALRVFACYLVVVFHVAMVFNPAPFYHVRNGDVNLVFLIFCGFISLWHMPLFFLLAGWSAAASLRARGAATFVRERVTKLAVPLVAGSVLMVPVIKYLELRSGLDLNHRGLWVNPELQQSFRQVIPIDLPLMAPFHESFLAFLPSFFTDVDRFSWSHLWFLAYLFVFSLVLLPVFVAVLARGRQTERTPSRLWLYAPLVPLVIVQLTLRGRYPGPFNLYNDWANVSYFATFLLAGFALFVFPRLEERLRTEWRRALGIGVAATVVLLAAVLQLFQSEPVVLTGAAVAGWCFILALLGFARERLHPSSARFAYLLESAFPVYLLHQLVVVVLGYWIVQLPLNLFVKFALLLVAALAGTQALYHYGVRPFRTTRFLAGLKRGPRGPRDALLPVGAAGRSALVIGLCLLPMQAGAAPEPTGLWWADRGFAQVEVTRCDDALCGRVVWLRHPFDEDGCPLRDVENPDRRLRGRSIVGIDLFHGLRASADEPGAWRDGHVYDPESGRTYRATLEMDGPDRLRLRGYVGVTLLGRTTTWTRVGSEQCREPA